ncbi:MAG: hypothetical protein ACOVNU_07985 [Candidatus Kapaibacteriota bacterium]
MKKVVVVVVVITTLSSCYKKETKPMVLKNVAYTIETTVLNDGTTLTVVNNPKIKSLQNAN